MIGGKFMSYKYKHPSSIVKLSGEEGRKIFYTILKKNTVKFDAKKASKQAHKELRKQGFYM